MLAGLSVAIALLAQTSAGGAGPAAAGAAPAYGPVTPAPPRPPESKPAESKPPAKPADEAVKPADEAAKAADRCAPPPPTTNDREIVVCAQKPQGYRLNPDVMEAKREMRSGGRPKRPDRLKDTSCETVGPAGCIGAGAGINLIGAALTAAEMAARLSRGQEIGSMFVTDPQPTEYQLYQEAKRRREAKEAEATAAAKAKAKAVGAATPAPASQPAPKP
jgi:hypothetical protein